MKKILAVVLDDANGMMYNNRRQSRDRLLIQDLADSFTSEILIAPYSEQLFKDFAHRIKVSDSPLADCPDGGVCFIEDPRLIPSIDCVDTIVIYRWLKLYPNDLSLPFSIEDSGFTLAQEYEFVGSSHDKIWKGIYRR